MARPSVLIVDDHAGFRSTARDLLSASGFEIVAEAADGRSAIAEAGRVRPSVVLLDVQLPDIDGFEVTRRLRGGAAPPVVVLVSTRDASDYGRRLRDSGAAGFITKSKLSGATLRALLPGLEEGTADG
jgi:DNA-binding NarL/FixJ family response regulator